MPVSEPSRIAASDTGPIDDLVLIGQMRLLPRLFETVSIPDVVQSELNRSRTPAVVRDCVAARPSWLLIEATPRWAGVPTTSLHDGERAVIALALSADASLVLMDDRAGVSVARSLGLAATGTLGILSLATERRLVDLPTAVARLRATSFRGSPEFYDALLARHTRP